MKGMYEPWLSNLHPATVRYTSLKLMPQFGMPFQNALVACLCNTRRLLSEEVFSEEAEGFFRRALGLYTHTFPKCGAALLTYLPHLCLGLSHSRLGLWHMRLSRNSGA